ncbi:MAG: NAD(+) synthase [Pseudoflavonifractor sp.]
MRDGFIKVAAGVPGIRVADCRFNAEACFGLMREADRQGVRLLCLPELCLTGASCGDLFRQEALLAGAEQALQTVLDATKNLDMITAIGLPLRRGGKLCSCAAVISKGMLLGLVSKEHLAPGEARQFAPADGDGPIFTCTDLPDLRLGIVLGEDFGAAVPAAQRLAARGATVILNLSAQPETVGAGEYRRGLISAQSARLHCGYLYAGAGEGESTTNGVFAGQSLISENGSLLAQRDFATGLTISELDVSRLAYERRREPFAAEPAGAEVPFALKPADTVLTRTISPAPFVPEDGALCKARCDEILLLSALGLKKRLEHTGAKTCVVGLSGGLDSTLAILITVLALKLLDRPASDVLAVTMPCFGTTDRTRDNAVLLAERLGASLRRIDIGESVRLHFADIGHKADRHDATFENAQARERTQVLMDLANETNGLVIGTGDLSELALGWCTYNGDHMSMYAVCAGIPKTLVRQLVSFVAGDKAEEDRPLSAVLTDIVETPISPELLPAVAGQMVQKTEDLVGPYELHDFFLYYMVRWGFAPRKILRLAEHAFGRAYDRATILKWMKLFYRRFFSQQFKRSCMPDGPKIGSVGLSPRGDWAMPSDGVAALWLSELDEIDE